MHGSHICTNILRMYGLLFKDSQRELDARYSHRGIFLCIRSGFFRPHRSFALLQMTPPQRSLDPATLRHVIATISLSWLIRLTSEHDSVMSLDTTLDTQLSLEAANASDKLILSALSELSVCNRQVRTYSRYVSTIDVVCYMYVANGSLTARM